MKLANDVLVEIIDIVRKGLVEQKDISDLLRDLDLEKDQSDKLCLTDKYKAKRSGVH